MARIRAYFRSRFRDPVVWLALSVMAAWGITAVFGLAPFQMLNVICFVFSAAEWWSLVSWWRIRRAYSADEVQELTPALERWKIGLLIGLAAVTFLVDLWVGSSTLTMLGMGFSVLGVSSFLTMWYAWSRPIIVTTRGLLVGIENVEWHEVRRVSWHNGGSLRIDFAKPNYFYGAKLSVAISAAQVAALEAMVPATVERMVRWTGSRGTSQPESMKGWLHRRK